MSAEPYKACRATVASWPTWENRPCAIKRGLQWDERRQCYWCHVHKPKRAPARRAGRTGPDDGTARSLRALRRIETMENRYTVSIVHGEHATLYHVVDAGAPEGEQPDIVLSLHNKPHAQAMAEELNKQAARIRELEGALRDMLAHVATIRNNLPMRDTRENHEFIMESWSVARRILAEGSVKA